MMFHHFFSLKQHFERVFCYTSIAVLLIVLGPLRSRADWYGDKYSMFVHYGLYSIPAGVYAGERVTRGYSEQILTFGIGFSDWYEAYAYDFDAQHFSASDIVSIAAASGMRSVVMTSKHHDGFCLWDTSTTDYNTLKGTPAARDLIGELSEECHRRGMGFGIYFSLIDWHYPAAVPFSSHNADRVTPAHHEYNKAQVRELLTQYGRVDELWFDMGSLTPEQSTELYQLVKSLQPHCQVSGRVGNDYADFCVMPDNEIPDYHMDMPWQTAASMFAETWGYRSWQERGSVEAKAAEKFRTLIEVISRGGKYLLNIGPMGDGSIVPFEQEVLIRVGEYIKPLQRAIYDTDPSPFSTSERDQQGSPTYYATTSSDHKQLYLFVPQGISEITIPATTHRHHRAAMLDGQRVHTHRLSDGSTRIYGITHTGSSPLSVVCLEYKQPVRQSHHSTAIPLGEHAAVVEPLYAQSSGDYYATFKSIVGYRHSVPYTDSPLCLSYPEWDSHRTLRVGTQSLLLPSEHPQIVHAPKVTPRGGLSEAYAPGLMGYIRPERGDYDYRQAAESWTTPIRRYVGSKMGLLLRQDLDADQDGDLPLHLRYTEGIVIYLNGEYIDAATALQEEGELMLLLPVRKGTNTIEIKLYARFGQWCSLQVTPSTQYTQYHTLLPTMPSIRGIKPTHTTIDIRRGHTDTPAAPAHLSGIRICPHTR